VGVGGRNGQPGHGLPTACGGGDLVGRDDEVGAALDLLDEQGVRVLTVVGQSGVGKTRVAHEVARRCAATRATLFLPLAAVSDVGLISDAVVDALPDHGGLRTRAADALWSVHGGDPVLVVLDNLEQIDGAAGAVLDLLAGYPALQVLATSLRPLEVGGEQVLRLRAFPPVVRDDPDDPALRLFLQRARAADAGFVDGSDVLPDVADLCDEVGGLPLAIELAAARAATLPPRLVVEQLRSGAGLALLRDRSVGRDVRHSSVAAAIEWSYLLLREEVQEAFRRASVFEGPFALDAAHAVVDPALDATTILDRFSDLVDVQLLDLEVGADGSSRFAMPSLMRAFARERLTGEEAEQCRDRHSLWFRALCSADPDNVRREWPEVAAALDTAVRRGSLNEALLAAVQAAPALTDAPGASSMLSRRLDDLADAGSEADPALATRALVWGTKQPADRRGDVESIGRWTSDRLTRALALARRSGDPAAVLAVLDLVVAAMPTTLDVTAAVSATFEGLELASRGRDQAMLARFEMYAAVVSRQGGDLRRTVELASSSLQRARGCGAAPVETAAALILLGLPPEARPQIDPPLPDSRDLLARCEAEGLRREAVIVLAGLAGEALARGEAAPGAAYLHRSLELGADVETTDPFLSLSPVPLVALAALAAGDGEAGGRIVASLSQVESALRPVLPPDVWAPYEAAATALRAGVPEPVWSTWVVELGGLTLPQINRHAQATARRLAGPALEATFPRPTPAAEPPAAMTGSPLTPRQREVLRALAGGGTYKEIGAELGMSAKTVMHHSAEIYRRLGVRGRGEATVWAFRHGLAAPTDGSDGVVGSG
jgi:predicted ATPase/DNA-binding CsgD family transcriptional regulator